MEKWRPYSITIVLFSRRENFELAPSMISSDVNIEKLFIHLIIKKKLSEELF